MVEPLPGGREELRRPRGPLQRPHTIHRERDQYEAEILEAKDRFPHFGALKLKRVTNIPLSHTTIHKVLADNDLANTRETTWRKFKHFERPTPNYLWQIDITQVPLPGDETGFICTILDDHSRFVLASKAFDKELNTGDVIGLLRAAMRQFGKPREILTDRGCQFHSNSDFPSLFTLFCYWTGVKHIRASPRRPRTIGKIERWHRSLKEEWCDRHPQPADHAGLRVLLSRWVDHYNAERPHCSLEYRTPSEVFLAGLMTEEGVYRLVNEVP